METPNFSAMIAQYEENARQAREYLRSVLEVGKPIKISVDVVASTWLEIVSVEKNAEDELVFVHVDGEECPCSHLDVVEAALQVQKKLGNQK